MIEARPRRAASTLCRAEEHKTTNQIDNLELLEVLPLDATMTPAVVSARLVSNLKNEINL